MFNAGAEKMRLFFALWPSDEVRGYLSEDTEAAVIQAGGKPVPPRNFHVTLAFLGDVRQSSLDDIVRTVRSVRFGSFALEFDQMGYWTNSRVAWLGPSKPHMALESLVENIWDKLENLGFMREYNPFKPHVSLCRDVDAELDVSRLQPIKWQVDAFVLAYSQPKPEGSVYTVLEQFPAGD